MGRRHGCCNDDADRDRGGCGGCGNSPCCCPGPTGPTGPSGGGSGSGSCFGQVDGRSFTLDGSPALVVTDADVQNPTFPGCRFRYLTFTGTSDGTIVTLPRPPGIGVYGYVLENRSTGPIFFQSQEAGPNVFGLPRFEAIESTVNQLALNPAGVFLYRTEVEVRADGVLGVPGYSSLP